MKNIIICEKDELKALIEDSISNFLEVKKSPSKKEYLSKEELIKMTGWSARTIQHLRDTRQIPFSQHGRKILYPYSGIVKFLEKNTVPPRSMGVLS